MSELIERALVIFKGEVQGVGFRYTAKRIASNYPGVTGTIRNLPDGNVEMIAEGTHQDLSDLISETKNTMHIYVSDMFVAKSTATGLYKSFYIVA